MCLCVFVCESERRAEYTFTFPQLFHCHCLSKTVLPQAKFQTDNAAATVEYPGDCHARVGLCVCGALMISKHSGKDFERQNK